MSFEFAHSARPPAYRYGAMMLLLCAGVIVAALGFEHIGGYIPCPLCLQQRYAYYAGVPLLFLALVLVVSEKPKLASFIFLMVSLAFLVNTGLGIYQAGAEWKFWAGPDTCSGVQGVATTAEDLLRSLETVHVVRCDEANFRFAGLSFAGWNAIVSFLIFIFTIKAAGSTSENRL